MPHGKLTVIVDSANGIKDPSKHGRGGSYCTLQCGNQVLSTHVAEGAGSHPSFLTEFKFEIDRSTNELFISVYSAGSMGDDELVGSTTLDFKTIFFHGHSVPLTAYPLSRLSGRAGGHISVSLQFKARPSPHAHTPHGPTRRKSAPLPTRPHHNIQPHDYETNYEDGYGSSGSSESSKRSGDLPYSRSQSQPEPYYEDYESPQADDFEYQPSRQPAHHAQPRYHHASPSAHQATPNVPNRPHRAITVKRGTAGPLQPVQRVQHQPQQGMPYQPQQGQAQQRMQGQTQQGMEYQPPQGMQGGQPQQGMQYRPPQGMQGGQPQQGMQGRPRQGMQYRPPQGMQGGQPQQGMQGRPRQGMQGQPRQRMQVQPQQRMQNRPPQGMQGQQQLGVVAHAVVAEVAQQGVQALAAGFGDMLGGLFG